MAAKPAKVRCTWCGRWLLYHDHEGVLHPNRKVRIRYLARPVGSGDEPPVDGHEFAFIIRSAERSSIRHDDVFVGVIAHCRCGALWEFPPLSERLPTTGRAVSDNARMVATPDIRRALNSGEELEVPSTIPHKPQR